MYRRAILKKILLGSVESGRIYATQHMRILFRAAAESGTIAELADWAIPLLLNQLKDKCRAVVMAAAIILDEITDDTVIKDAFYLFCILLIEFDLGLHRCVNNVKERVHQVDTPTGKPTLGFQGEFAVG